MFAHHKQAKRPIGHPFLAAQRPGEAFELPSGAEAPSRLSDVEAARGALEEMFSDLPASEDSPATHSPGGPTVVVKRRRTLGASVGRDSSDSIASCAQQTEQATPPLLGQELQRESRVFRVGQSLKTAQEPSASFVGLLAGAADASRSVVPVAPPIVAAKRPPRRAAPVVISTFPASSMQLSARRTPVAAAATGRDDTDLAFQLAALDETLMAIRAASELRFIDPVPIGTRQRANCYAALRERIALLRQKEQALRHAEVTRALTWIKPAIVKYNLTREDLGI